MALSEDRQPTTASFHARSAVVNRTHRVIRERAAEMQAQKRRVRDLLVPVAVCSVVLMFIAVSVWSVADEGLAGWEDSVWKRISTLGGDAGSSISILLVWFLPLSVITAAIVMLRRSRNSARDDGRAR